MRRRLFIQAPPTLRLLFRGRLRPLLIKDEAEDSRDDEQAADASYDATYDGASLSVVRWR
jgi:hypothetical protein